MGFRFQRRISLGKGLGLNLSGSGGSLSYRGKSGSIGTSGFSVRTGIPGLSFRQSWGKGGGATAIIFVGIYLSIAAAVLVVQIAMVVIPLLYQIAAWLVLTSYDLGRYALGGVRRWIDERPRLPPPTE